MLNDRHLSNLKQPSTARAAAVEIAELINTHKLNLKYLIDRKWRPALLLGLQEPEVRAAALYVLAAASSHSKDGFKELLASLPALLEAGGNSYSRSSSNHALTGSSACTSSTPSGDSRSQWGVSASVSLILWRMAASEDCRLLLAGQPAAVKLLTGWLGADYTPVQAAAAAALLHLMQVPAGRALLLGAAGSTAASGSPTAVAGSRPAAGLVFYLPGLLTAAAATMQEGGMQQQQQQQQQQQPSAGPGQQLPQLGDSAIWEHVLKTHAAGLLAIVASSQPELLRSLPAADAPALLDLLLEVLVTPQPLAPSACFGDTQAGQQQAGFDPQPADTHRAVAAACASALAVLLRSPAGLARLTHAGPSQAGSAAGGAADEQLQQRQQEAWVAAWSGVCQRLCNAGSGQVGRLLGSPAMAALLLDVLAAAAAACPPCSRRLSRGTSTKKGAHAVKVDSAGPPTVPSADASTAVGIHVLALLRHMCYWPDLAAQLAQLNRGELLLLLKPYLLAGPGKAPSPDAASDVEGGSQQADVFAASAAALAAALMRSGSGARPSAVAGLLAAASEALPEWLGLLVAGRAGGAGPVSWQQPAFCWLAVCGDVATADEGPLASAGKALTRLRGAVGALISCLGDSLDRLAAGGRGQACSQSVAHQLEQRELLAGLVGCCKLLEVAAVTSGLTTILVTRTSLTTTLLDLALAAATAAGGDSPPVAGSSSGLQASHVAGCAALLLAALCQGCSPAAASKALVSQPQCIPALQALVALPDCWGPCAALLGALVKLPGYSAALLSSGVGALLNHLLLDKLSTSTATLRGRVAAGVCDTKPAPDRQAAVAVVFDRAACSGSSHLLLGAAGTHGLDGVHGWAPEAMLLVLGSLPAFSSPSAGGLDTSSRDGSSQLLAALLEVCDSVAAAAGMQPPGGAQQPGPAAGQSSADGAAGASDSTSCSVSLGHVPGVVSWWGSSSATRSAAQLLLASLSALKQLGGLPRQQLLQQYPYMLHCCQSVLDLLLAPPAAGGTASFRPPAEQQHPFEADVVGGQQVPCDLAQLSGALWQQLMECMSTWAATWAAAHLKPRLSDGKRGAGVPAPAAGAHPVGATLQLLMVGISICPGAWAVRLAAARGLSAVLAIDPSLVATLSRQQAQQLLSCILSLTAAPANTCSSASSQGVGGPGGVLHLTTDALALQQQLTAEAEAAALALDCLLGLASHGSLIPVLAASRQGCSCCPLAAVSGLVEVLGALLQEDVLVQVNMALRRLAATAARTQAGAANAGRPAPGPPSREPSMSAAQDLRRTVSLGSSTTGGGAGGGDGGSEGPALPAPTWSTPAATARLAALDLRATSARLLVLLLCDQQAWCSYRASNAAEVPEAAAVTCGCSCRCAASASAAAENPVDQGALVVPLSLLQALEGLLNGGNSSTRMAAVQALWCFGIMPGGADMLLGPSHGLVPALLGVIRGTGGALRLAAVSLLARLAQAATDDALTGLCNTDGLCTTLVEALSAGLEQLQEPSLQEAAAGPQSSDGLLAPGSRPQVSGSQLAEDMAGAALTTLGALCRCGSLAARLASTRGLPGALLGTLRAGRPALLSAAAALVAGLTCHKASAGVAGAAPGLARMLLASVKSGAASHDLLPVYCALRNLAAVDASRTEMASDPSVGIVLVSPLAHLPPSAASSAAGSAASSFSSGPGAQRGNTRPPPGGSGSSSGGLLQHVMSTIGSPLVLLDVQIAAAAALVNLTAEKLGCEALLMEHPRILPVLAASLAHCQATTSGATSRPGSRRASAAGADGLGLAPAAGTPERATRPVSAGTATTSGTPSNIRPRSAGAPPSAAAGMATSAGAANRSEGVAGAMEADTDEGEVDAAVAATFLLGSKLWVVLANCCRHPSFCSVLASQQQLMGLLLQQVASIPLPINDSSSEQAAEASDSMASSSRAIEGGAAVRRVSPAPGQPEQGVAGASSAPPALTRRSSSWWDLADRAHADVAALRCCQCIVTTCPHKLLAALQQAARGAVETAASSSAASTSPAKGPGRRARSTAAATASQQAVTKTILSAGELLAHAATLLCWVDVALLADAVASGTLQLDLTVVGRPSAADGEGLEGEVEGAAGHLSAEASASTSESVPAAAGVHEMWVDLGCSALAVASAAAGLLGLAVSVGWVPPAPSPATLASLTTLLLLPTLPGAAGTSQHPTTPGRSSASMGTVWPRLGATLAAGGPEELEAVAGQAAVCSWALASHPAASAPGWPLALSSNSGWCHALLALVRGYQGAGSKVRYHPCRLVPAVILGQVLIAGLLPDNLVVQLATPPVVSSLVDACSLAPTAAALAGAATGGGGAGQPPGDRYPGGSDTGATGGGRISSGSRAVSPGRSRPESGAPPGSPTAAKARAGSPVRRAPGPAAASGLPSSPSAGGGPSREEGGGPLAASAAPRLLKPSRSLNRQSNDPAAAAKLAGLAAVGCSLQLAGVLGLQAATSLAHIAAWAAEQPGGMYSSSPSSDSTAWGSPAQEVFTRCCPSLVPTLASLLDSRLPEVLLVGSMALATVSSLGPAAATVMAKDGRLLGKVARLLQSCQDDAVAAYLLVVLTNACSQPTAAAQVVRYPALLPCLVGHLSGWVAQPWAGGKCGDAAGDAGAPGRSAAPRAVASPRTLQATEGVATAGSPVKSMPGMPRALVAYLPNKPNKRTGAGRSGAGAGRARGVQEGNAHQHAMARATAAASCLCNLAVADVVLTADVPSDGTVLHPGAAASDSGGPAAGAASGMPPQGAWLLADPLWDALEGLLGSAADTLLAASQLEDHTSDGTEGGTGNGGGGSEQSEQLVVFLLAMLPMMLGLAANVAAQPSAVVTKAFEARPAAAAMLVCLLRAVQEEGDRLTLLSTMCRLVAVAGTTSADAGQQQSAQMVAIPGEVQEQQVQQQHMQAQPPLSVNDAKPCTPPHVPSLAFGNSSMESGQSFAAALGAAVSSASQLLSKWVAAEATSRSVRQAAQWLLRSATG